MSRYISLLKYFRPVFESFSYSVNGWDVTVSICGYDNHVRVVAKKNGKCTIWYLEWWGDELVVYENDELVKISSNDHEINSFLTEIAQKVEESG